MSKDSVSPTDILTLPEVCLRLKVKPGWIYAQTRESGPHSLPYYKVGQQLRFRWSAIEAWLETRAHGIGAPASRKRRAR